ncbi:hypothetical protein OAS66_09330 [Alphaproteobacteria bacterium]|nr:hypothetical protein [Alphaproteobacteria bacterium]
MDLTENISAQPARLIPTVADSNKEQRVVSVALSMMSQVPELSQGLLQLASVNVGQRTSIMAFTEVQFKNPESRGLRPDGLLIVSTGKKVWRALIEAKIGNSKLDPEQIKNYIDIAKAHKIDSVITISNQFTPRADHHPSMTIRRSDARRVDLFHWSWSWIKTKAQLLIAEDRLDDPEQQFLLQEFYRFLDHPSTGVQAFSQMPQDWKSLITLIRNNTPLRRNTEEVESIVAAWQQASRHLALKLTTHVARRVNVRLSRSQQLDQDQWLKDGCDELIKLQVLSSALEVPDSAGPIEIRADLRTRSIEYKIRLKAPPNRKSTTARVNWLIRQIKSDDHTNLYIRAIRPGSSKNTMKPLTEIYANSNVLAFPKYDVPASALEVVKVVDLASKFTGNKKFIEELESGLAWFYDSAVQYLRAWQPAPPRPVEAPPQTFNPSINQFEHYDANQEYAPVLIKHDPDYSV